MEFKEFVDKVKSELPHIKYVIDSLHNQELNSGALPQIYNNLFKWVEATNISKKGYKL